MALRMRYVSTYESSWIVYKAKARDKSTWVIKNINICSVLLLFTLKFNRLGFIGSRILNQLVLFDLFIIPTVWL